jgi:hypothetical protein
MDSSRSCTSITWNSRKAGVSSTREIDKSPDLGLVRQGPLQT